MMQFYFLSILLNLITGSILLYSCENPQDAEDDFDESSENPDLDSEKKSKIKKIFYKIFGTTKIAEDSLFHLIIGFLTVFTGLVKLLSPCSSPIFLGDLLPALAGLVGGASLLLLYFSQKSEVEINLPSFLEKIFISERKIVAIALIVIAIVHFIVPGVLFL